MNKKAFALTLITGTMMGWLWNWIHYKAGVTLAWSFKEGETFGLLVFGIPAVDWAFYFITGWFFLTMVIFDPLRRYLPDSFGDPRKYKCCFYFLLVFFVILGFVIFGCSGIMTAYFFGITSLLMYIYIWREWNVYHFMRTGLIIVPTNVLWEIWATPVTRQWWYNKESLMFSDDFWWWGIPFEMTPYLGIMSWYFIFGLYKTYEKVFSSGK